VCIDEHLMLFFKAGIARVNEYRENLVLRVNSLFLSPCGDNSKSECQYGE
jgi:hypothetical protein